jgi:hypothetical protein
MGFFEEQRIVTSGRKELVQIGPVYSRLVQILGGRILSKLDQSGPGGVPRWSDLELATEDPKKKIIFTPNWSQLLRNGPDWSNFSPVDPDQLGVNRTKCKAK